MYYRVYNYHYLCNIQDYIDYMLMHLHIKHN